MVPCRRARQLTPVFFPEESHGQGTWQAIGHSLKVLYTTEVTTHMHACGQESFRRNGAALIVNKRVQNEVLGCNLKNDRMISVHFQAKPFNITVIQVYAPTTNTKEAEVEWFYEDPQDFLELTPK